LLLPPPLLLPLLPLLLLPLLLPLLSLPILLPILLLPLLLVLPLGLLICMPALVVAPSRCCSCCHFCCSRSGCTYARPPSSLHHPTVAGTGAVTVVAAAPAGVAHMHTRPRCCAIPLLPVLVLVLALPVLLLLPSLLLPLPLGLCVWMPSAYMRTRLCPCCRHPRCRTLMAGWCLYQIHG
jgi:hypothetical protein